MTNQNITARLDHTLLKATAAWDEIKTLCNEALEYKTASACIPPCYVKRARDAFPDLTVCTVIGFPLGYSTVQAKIAETETALADGASEIDMVINIALLKSGCFGMVEDEISRIRKTAGDALLKVIVETCYLTEEEKIHICGIVTRAGADYIKTSTGFGGAGAALEDIALFKKHIGKRVKIKAAGGIKTREAMIAFLEAGCSRIGSSSAVQAFSRQS
ncbi:MAG: deoxyribose-phosphate aldolase [Treponema sp.]|jgi:deoxyribose-phosphate aldolase|nr:deoxyribose-phosphate aldolase [Treponema sp.]